MHHGFRLVRSLVVAFLLCVTTLPNPPPAHAQPTGHFGVDEGYQAPDLFHQSGASWDRINFHWDSMQPTGPTDWLPVANVTDGDIANDLAAGMTVVGVITNPPAWATRNGSVPANLTLVWTDPLNYWSAYVHRLAGQYAGRIDTWIIWNEPDIDPGRPGSTWAGSENEFYLLTKAASLATHAANANARIVFAGTTYWSDILQSRKLFLERVLEQGSQDPDAPANGYFFDAVDIHIYSSPYQIYTIPNAYRDVLQRFSLSKPIWVSELNVVPWNDPASKVPHGGYRATLDEQAAYMIQAVAMARVANLERAAVYKMVDGTIIRGEPFGLARNDGTTRPAYHAFQAALRYIDLPGTVSFETRGAADVVVVDGGKHRVTVAWNTRPTPMDLTIGPMGTAGAQLTKVGDSAPLALPTDPNQPNYVFHLAGATDNAVDANPNDYIVGGDPVILIEDGVGDPVTVSPTMEFYPITGFSVSGAFLDYFQHRGGLRTFGYPISRRFMLLGNQVQFFQRRILQARPDGTVGQLNLLEGDYMPYTEINNATFPAEDLGLTKQLPGPTAKDYNVKIMQYVQQATPDNWNGLTVNFKATFTTTVSIRDAFPTGKPQPSLLPGLNLELWGVPISAPAVDPNNNNFVYQRFQRGIMHFDKTTGVTQGLLLADYFKSIITGQNLPADLDQVARGSRFYRQYDASHLNWLARPNQLPNTFLAFAFERQAVGQQ
jgi:hypothetical protein